MAMLLALLSVFILFSSRCQSDWSFVVENYECEQDEYTAYDALWTRSLEGYWISGQNSYHSNHYEDRKYRFEYCRPNDPNTDWDYTETTKDLSLCRYNEEWTRDCGSGWALSQVHSYHDDDTEDREFRFTCGHLPNQFYLAGCTWSSDWENAYNEALDYTCNEGEGVMRGIQSIHDNDREDRRFKFYCCPIKNRPMDISSTYSSDRVLTEITSTYSSNTNTRSTFTATFGKPRWYQNGANTVAAIYSLTDTHTESYHWVRLCPRNGAFTSLVQNTDGTFSFECALLIDGVTVDECSWTDYINEFHASFTGNCAEDGAIRGIESYYSPSSNDRKFKIYCCVLKRGIYTIDHDIVIKAKVHNDEDSGGVITFDLCWNNNLYQAVMTLRDELEDGWGETQDLISYGSCGNQRMISIFTASIDMLKLSDIGVGDNGVDYIINEFDTGTTTQTEFELDVEETKSVMIKYPDDYLTGCNGNSVCTGTLSDLDDYQQYLITINPCVSFSMESGTPEIAVILRGINGNLDQKILSGSFDEMQVGHGNIGQLFQVHISHAAGPEFCVENVIVHDPYNGNQEFGQDYFADGIILSSDCTGLEFKLLTHYQYVPCYETPFSIVTYETSVYTSVQLHTCAHSHGAVGAAASAALSLTITGMSKDGKFVSTNPLSLQSETTWAASESRDFTLPISGDFGKVSLITLTNLDSGDMCVDSVLINGVDAFLTHYWVGLDGTGHGAIHTIPAVLEWPICDIELTTVISAETPLPMDPESVATSTCVNMNRLMPVNCEISQTFQTYEEVSWNQQMGEEVTDSVTIEAGTGTTVSTSLAVTGGIEQELKSGVTTTKKTFSATASDGNDRTWSSSTSSSNGVTTLDITTDGTVNGETIGIECSGSVSVPPSQQVSYALLIDHTAATLTTLTDIKMTKCSAYLYGEDHYDPNDYVYIYGIEGELTVKDATNCYVSFSQSEQVSTAGSITCGEERALATREWGTYVPQCNDVDPTLYNKCQCAFGDSRTLPTCGCVDETTGNLLDTAQASVVDETDSYKWSDWCNDNCVPSSSAKYVPPHLEHDSVIDKVVENVKKDFVPEYKLSIYLLVVAMFGIMGTYMINSCIECYKKCAVSSNENKYQICHFDTDTEIEKNVVLKL